MRSPGADMRFENDPWKACLNLVPTPFECFRQPSRQLVSKQSRVFSTSTFRREPLFVYYTLVYDVPDLELSGTLQNVKPNLTILEIKDNLKLAIRTRRSEIRLMMDNKYQLQDEMRLEECIALNPYRLASLVIRLVIQFPDNQQSQINKFSVILAHHKEDVQVTGLYPLDLARRLAVFAKNCFGLQIQAQRLLHAGSQIDLGLSLQEIGLKEGSRIEVLKRQKGGLTLTIPVLQGTQYKIDVEQKTTISEIKTCLASLSQIPHQDQKLMFKGSELLDCFCLRDYKVPRNATILLVKKTYSVTIDFKPKQKTQFQRHCIDMSREDSWNQIIYRFRAAYPRALAQIKIANKNSYYNKSSLAQSSQNQGLYLCLYETNYRHSVFVMLGDAGFEYQLNRKKSTETSSTTPSDQKSWLLKKLEDETSIAAHRFKLRCVYRQPVDSISPAKKHFVGRLDSQPTKAVPTMISMLDTGDGTPRLDLFELRSGDVFLAEAIDFSQLRVSYGRNKQLILKTTCLQVSQLYQQIQECQVFQESRQFSIFYKGQILIQNRSLSDYEIFDVKEPLRLVDNVEGGWVVWHSEILKQRPCPIQELVRNHKISTKYLYEPVLSALQPDYQLLVEKLPQIISSLNICLVSGSTKYNRLLESYLQHWDHATKYLEFFCNRICYAYLEDYSSQGKSEYVEGRYYCWPQIWLATASFDSKPHLKGTLFIIRLLSGRLINHRDKQLVLGQPFTYFRVRSVVSSEVLTQIELIEVPIVVDPSRLLWVDFNPKDSARLLSDMQLKLSVNISVAQTSEQLLFAAKKFQEFQQSIGSKDCLRAVVRVGKQTVDLKQVWETLENASQLNIQILVYYQDSVPSKTSLTISNLSQVYQFAKEGIKSLKSNVSFRLSGTNNTFQESP